MGEVAGKMAGDLYEKVALNLKKPCIVRRRTIMTSATIGLMHLSVFDLQRGIGQSVQSSASWSARWSASSRAAADNDLVAGC